MAELITFRCGNCQHVLKVGMEKAGRKAKCPKCGHGVTVPGADGATTDSPRPEPPPAPKPDDEEDASAYNLLDEPLAPTPKMELLPTKEDEEEAAARGEKPRKKAAPTGPAAQKRGRAVQRKTLLEPERWQSVKLALQVI